MRLHPATTGCGPCGNLPKESPGLEHDLAAHLDIDVVYTWVNGTDPVHAAKRRACLGEQKDVHDNGLDSARFRDNNELLFSLRALETFAPWVRNVILVTDNQVPAWIRTDHPKLRIVDHREFIPHGHLPTFNSHVIESFLHNIPGLSEHFIYLNDDVFLSRPARKSDFFTSNGIPVVCVDWRKRRLFGYHYTKTPHAQSYFNTLQLLKEGGVPTDPRFITAHGPYPQTIANMRAAFEFYRPFIDSYVGNRFRTSHELALYCHAAPLYLLHLKKIVPRDERYYYVQTMRRDRVAYYMAILHSLEDRIPPFFFCINDVGKKKTVGRWRKDLSLLLETCFPEPSGYEC